MSDEMTPEQKIDSALDSVLRASGSALKHYTMHKTLDDMRVAMRSIIDEAYTEGANSAFHEFERREDQDQICEIFENK